MKNDDAKSFHCNISRKNYTKLFTISNKMEGIPENFVLNCGTAMLLLFLYCLIQKSAWNYGRSAMLVRVSKNLGEADSLLLPKDPSLVEAENDWLKSSSRGSRLDYVFKGLLMLRMSHLVRSSGIDAEQYLLFQKYIIIYMAIICILSLAIILPINLSGDHLTGSSIEFSHTTLANVNPASVVLWVHVFMSLLFFYVGLYLMIQYKKNLDKYPKQAANQNTIMIVNIPRAYCDIESIKKHVLEIQSDVETEDIKIIYDSRRLNYLTYKVEQNLDAQFWCERYYQDNNERFRMIPKACGWLCCCTSETVDGLEFYRKEELELNRQIRVEKENMVPLGIALLTFKTDSMAEALYNRFKMSKQISSLHFFDTLLSPAKWEMVYVPDRDDVIWNNVSTNWALWYVRFFFINLLLMIIFIFFTTPVILMNNLSLLNMDPKMLAKQVEKVSLFLSEFFPSLLLLLFTVTLPSIIIHTSLLFDHWTRTARNHSIMVYTYFYLIFMVLILPSLSLTSVSALTTALSDADMMYRWTCVFLPDNGAFFINYVITSTFIGSSLDLLRLPDVFHLILRSLFVRSRAELRNLGKHIVNEFEFGIRYSWYLVIFTVVLTYSVSCPLITPFGLMYMILKHFVDRYNLQFVCTPSKINLSIHTTAMNFVVCSPILAQLSLLSFFIIRQGIDQYNTFFNIIVICTSVILQFWFNVS